MRWILITLGSVIALIGLAVSALVVLIDPDDYRDSISEVVQAQTGRSLSIDGSISWALFPRLGIDLREVSLGSGGGLNEFAFFSAKRLSLGIEIMPLLRGELALEAITIDAPVLNLVRATNGKANWQDFGRQANASDSPSEPPQWLAGLSLGGISLSDGQIRFNDQVTGKRWQASDVDFALETLIIGRSSGFSADGQFEQDNATDQATIAGELTIRADRSLSLEKTNLQIDDIAITDFNVDVAITPAGIRLHPINARFFEGDYQGDVTLVRQSANRPLRFNESLTNTQVGPLLAALVDVDQLVGKGTVDLTGELELAGQASAIETLNASGGLSLRDGAIEGINIAQVIRNALARLEGRKPTSESTAQRTDFSQLSATLSIVNGIAHSNDLALDSPLLRIRGEIRSDLAAQTLNANLTVNIVDTLEGQDGQALESLRGIPIPLQVTGPWGDPSIRVNIAKVIEQTQSEPIRERIEQEVNELRDRIEGLFNE
ncbi:MAG: AsmA family protein [Spiribacter sp.]|jgi:AsmA protein|nr:AsmA family protein [Spiribacter sp.]